MAVSIFFSEAVAPVYHTSYQMRGALNVLLDTFFSVHGHSARLLVLGVQKFKDLAKEVLSPAQQLEAELNPLAVRLEYRDTEILLDLKDPTRTDVY
jgi:hypothetical protein